MTIGPLADNRGIAGMQHESEPSVEEILASIKKVIARDNRENAAELRRSRSQAGTSASSAEPQNDVLELGDAEQYREEPDMAATGDRDEPLLDAAVSASMRESLDALAMLAEPGARPRIVRSGETSLEGLVREMLRPMLAKWLERNLPAMVEQLVAAEIARIAGKRD